MFGGTRNVQLGELPDPRCRLLRMSAGRNGQRMDPGSGQPGGENSNHLQGACRWFRACSVTALGDGLAEMMRSLQVVALTPANTSFEQPQRRLPPKAAARVDRPGYHKLDPRADS
jgi:hypothetical protein